MGPPTHRAPKLPKQQKKKFQNPESLLESLVSPKVNVVSPKVNAISPKVNVKYFREFFEEFP